jgi:hypothetical protein
MSDISRRKFLRTAPVAAAAVTVPSAAIAVHSPSPALAELGHQYHVAKAALEPIAALFNRAETLFLAERKRLFSETRDDLPDDLAHPEPELVRLMQPVKAYLESPEAKAVTAERERRMEKRKAQREAAEETAKTLSSLREAETAHNDAVNAYADAERNIIKFPVVTFGDLVEKARLIDGFTICDYALDDLVADILRVGGKAVAS